jgi:WD40 repeat protein
MLESFEQHFGWGKQKSLEQIKKKKALELVQEIEEITKGMIEKGETVEDYRRIRALLQEIEKIYEKKIIGWQLEGKLTEENVLAEYQAGEEVRAANFSPEGDRVVIGSSDGMMRVISLTEKDEQGKPEVLAEYKAGEPVWAVNFSPEGDRVVIGSGDGMMRVISLTEKDEQGKPNVLAEYQAVGVVWAANFSPEGDKVVIGSSDGMMRVISLTERDEQGKPEVLA